MNPLLLAAHTSLKKLCIKHGYCIPDKLLRFKCRVTQPIAEKAGSCIPGLCIGVQWPGELPKEYQKEGVALIHDLTDTLRKRRKRK